MSIKAAQKLAKRIQKANQEDEADEAAD